MGASPDRLPPVQGSKIRFVPKGRRSHLWRLKKSCCPLNSNLAAILGASETQRTPSKMVERLVTKYGTLPVIDGTQAYNTATFRMIMDDYAGKPGIGCNMLSTLRVLMALTISNAILKDDRKVGWWR